MKIWYYCVILLCAVAFAGCQPAANNSNAGNAPPANKASTDDKKASGPTDLKALASRVVTQSAGVKEGEIVLISGSARDAELLENLEVEVAKAGGYPFVELNNEKAGRRSYDEVPEKFDSKEPKLGMALAKIANVTINIDSTITDGLFGDVPPARLAARAKAGAPVQAEFTKNKIRSVEIGNGLYPTEWRARQFEMPVDDFAKLFWEGINIDYTDLQARGEKARAAVAGKEMEITHPNGTSIKVNLDGRPAYISDGVISADDVAKGNLNAYLPAGECASITAAGSGTGKFVIDKDYFNGKEVHNVVLQFENGKLTSYTGEGDGWAALKASYDAGKDGNTDLLSYIDIGINPNYALAPSSKYGNWVSAGMVSLGTGNNTWAGGSNNSTGGIGGHLAGCTVKIDGKVVVEDGVLKV